MKTFKFRGLATTHPGGIGDIVDFIERTFDRHIVADEINKHWSPMDATEPHDMTETALGDVVMAQSWVLMGVFVKILKGLQLPVPGERAWEKPCKTWRQRDDGSFS